MKNNLLVILGTFISSCAFANPFTGAYVTGALGGISSNFQIRANTTLIDPGPPPLNIFNLNNNANVYANSLIGSVGAGYAFCYKDFIYGVEGDADFFKTTRNQSGSFSQENAAIFMSTNTKVELKNSYALLFRAGWLMDPLTLLYGFIGPRWGNFDISQSARFHEEVVLVKQNEFIVNGSTSNRRSLWRTGFTVGFGVQQALWRNLSAAVEYAFTDYGNISTPNTATGIVSSEGVPLATINGHVRRVEAFTNALTFKLFYNFW